MERLDFASVMAALRRNISDDRCPNQVELVYALFRDFCTEQPDMEFDNGQICRWINGLARLSPRITAYYQENRNRRKLANTIESHILPMMPDSAMAVQELHDLLIQAPNVSSQKKAELTEPADPAVFVTEVLCFAMELRFEKRDARKPALIPAGSRSPAVADFIFSADVPRPCRWFQGRESELEQLHRLLMTERKVFLHGIPGIGKSELAKVYNAQHGREYTNVLYLNYTGSLIRDIAKLDFADDLPDEAEDIRFLRHDCFLRSLREDTLLIVDNFNAIASQDTYLDAMLQYRCRILFTTRCRFEDQISLELTELPPASLLGLMKYFYPDSGTVEAEIIELLHRHTFAVELAARLLANGILSPEILWQKLWVEKSAMDAEDRISSAKDGKSRRATYYDHIHTLFALSLLTCNQSSTSPEQCANVNRLRTSGKHRSFAAGSFWSKFPRTEALLCRPRSFASIPLQTTGATTQARWKPQRNTSKTGKNSANGQSGCFFGAVWEQERAFWPGVLPTPCWIRG